MLRKLYKAFSQYCIFLVVAKFKTQYLKLYLTPANETSPIFSFATAPGSRPKIFWTLYILATL